MTLYQGFLHHQHHQLTLSNSIINHHHQPTLSPPSSTTTIINSHHHCSQSLYTLTLIEEYLWRRRVPGREEFWQKNKNYFRWWPLFRLFCYFVVVVFVAFVVVVVTLLLMMLLFSTKIVFSCILLTLIKTMQYDKNV